MEMCLKAISAQLSDRPTTISNGFLEISFMNQKKKKDFAVQQKQPKKSRKW